MDNKNKEPLTLEGRMAPTEKSQAVPPEDAVRQVQKFGETCAAEIFCGNADLDTMNELTGEFWEHPLVDINTYHGFCGSFFLAKNHDNPLPLFSSLDIPEEPPTLVRPVWGIRMNNAMVLLGLMLLDHAKGRLKSRESICRCMQMTLEQYQDALLYLMRQDEEDRNPLVMNADFIQSMWTLSLKGYDASRPLADALADFLGWYIEAWKEFDRLDHILRCMDALICYLEQESAREDLPPAETDRRRQDPYGYYLALAREYPDDIPDPGSDGLDKGAVRSRIFLSKRDYSPEALLALAAKAPSREFRELLEEKISGERLDNAMKKLNKGVRLLYWLWVEPYLAIWNCGGGMKAHFRKLLSDGIAAAEQETQN